LFHVASAPHHACFDCYFGPFRGVDERQRLLQDGCGLPILLLRECTPTNVLCVADLPVKMADVLSLPRLSRLHPVFRVFERVSATPTLCGAAVCILPVDCHVL
jgi:hypothetical protein